MDRMYGDSVVVWSALAVVLTVLGVLWARRRWETRGVGPGLRALAVAVLPIAALLTGTLRLATRIGSAFTDWATHLVFSPVVWVGVVLAGGAVALWVVGTMVTARGLGVRERPTELPRQGRAPTTAAESPAAGGMDGMEDIEAILRKHGIQ